MTIFAIDPGPEESSFVVYDSDKQEIVRKGNQDNPDLRNSFRAENQWADILVIEQMAHMAMEVGFEVFETVFWSGVFAEAWGGRYDRIDRGKIKMHLCGSVRAKDKNIRQSLIDKFGPPGTKKSPGKTYGISKHLWAALAVAVTYAETKGKP